MHALDQLDSQDDWVDAEKLEQALLEAIEGESEAIDKWIAASPLRAAADDYQSLVVILKRAANCIGDRWHTYNRPPRPGEEYLWACKYIQIRDTGLRGISFPLPRSRVVQTLRFKDGCYTFELASTELHLTIHQIHQVCVKAINASGLTESQLQDIFDASPSFPPDPPTPPLEPLETTTIHPIWGRLKYVPSVRWFEGRHRLGLRRFELTFDCDRQGSADGALRRSEAVSPVIRQTIERAKHYAATELVELQHDWAEGQQPELDELGFARKLKLRSINFKSDGDVELWFADSNMFYGHDIRVCMNADDRFTRAGIEG